MKIGIFYATKTNVTAKCAKLLSEKLPGSHLIDVSEVDDNVLDYDFIVVGSSVRMGRLHKNIKKFLKKNRSKLYNKKVGYFLCNAFTNKTEQVLKENIHPSLFNRALIISSFGGEIDLEKQKGLDRVLVKLISKLKSYEFPKIDEEKIYEFSERVKYIGLR